MYANLIAEMKCSKITQLQLAEALGITNRGLNKKLFGGSFKSEEMFLIQDKFFPDKDLRTLFAKS